MKTRLRGSSAKISCFRKHRDNPKLQEILALPLTRLRGRLLLAETYLKMKDFEQAKRVLDAIPDWSLAMSWSGDVSLCSLNYSWPRRILLKPAKRDASSGVGSQH